ncbi:MAG TPA: DUF6516 family protein [Anaerolineales bacterium]|nr:DUF6516 family protein [Anaerolineales bacterium]
MNNLVDDILETLQTHALVKTTRVVYYDETPNGELEVKIRCSLPKSHQLQVWIHVEPESLDYAYQLFTSVPLLRWDNAPHYGHLSSAPHHFHDEQGNVYDSVLTGNVKKDLKIVLGEISEWMKAHDKQE